MPDETRPSSEDQELQSLPVAYTGMEDTPVYGCDHIKTLRMPTDGAILVQMFMTLPPRINVEDRSILPITSKCIGQFHLTPETARSLVDSILVDLSDITEEES